MTSGQWPLLGHYRSLLMIFDATTRPWLTLLSKTSRNWKRSKDQNGRDFNSWKRGGWESNQWTNKWKSIGFDSTWEVYWKFERSTYLHFILRFIQNLLIGISRIDGMADILALILVALAIADPCVKGDMRELQYINILDIILFLCRRSGWGEDFNGQQCICDYVPRHTIAGLE